MTNIGKYDENLIEIAWFDQELTDKEKYEANTDSMDEKLAIIELAKQFEKDHENVDWNMKGNYYVAIREYAMNELLKRFGKKSTYRVELTSTVEVRAGSKEEAEEIARAYATTEATAYVTELEEM